MQQLLEERRERLQQKLFGAGDPGGATAENERTRIADSSCRDGHLRRWRKVAS